VLAPALFSMLLLPKLLMIPEEPVMEKPSWFNTIELAYMPTFALNTATCSHSPTR